MEHNTECFVKSRGLRKPVRYGNSPFAFVTLVTLISGAGGTGLGGLIGALFKSESNRTISLLLAFAGGVMTAMVCFDLLAEAEEAASQVTEHGVLLVILAVALGVAVVYLLNHLSDLMWGTGMIMAVLIGLHNIPEGMAVAVPLISGGTGRVRATLLTAACGLPTVLGAWLGFWLGDIGPLGLTMSLGFASGAMLYVVFGEIMPESYLIYRSKLPAFAVMVGLALGMFMIFF